MNRVISKFWNVLRHDGFLTLGNLVVHTLKIRYKMLTFKPYKLELILSGETIQLIIPDLFAEGWYNRYSEWSELTWLKDNCLKKGDFVVDCGMNIGFTSIFFAKCVGDTGKVVGFEALPRNAVVAQKNIELNKISNCTVMNLAVGEREGIVDFLDHPNSSIAQSSNKNTVKVEVVRLDDIFPLEKPTFLKIDVEGHELAVLSGATEILKTCPKLNIEVHCFLFQDPNYTIREIFRLLSPDTYQLYLQLVAEGEIFPYDPELHTYEYISKHNVIHLFGLPRKRN